MGTPDKPRRAKISEILDTQDKVDAFVDAFVDRREGSCSGEFLKTIDRNYSDIFDRDEFRNQVALVVAKYSDNTTDELVIGLSEHLREDYGLYERDIRLTVESLLFEHVDFGPTEEMPEIEDPGEFGNALFFELSGNRLSPVNVRYAVQQAVYSEGTLKTVDDFAEAVHAVLASVTNLTRKEIASAIHRLKPGLVYENTVHLLGNIETISYVGDGVCDTSFEEENDDELYGDGFVDAGVDPGNGYEGRMQY